jgi:signal transduction histidine kinase/DNA-binding response OmpR family regulator
MQRFLTSLANFLMPIVVALILLVGWIVVMRQEQVLTDAASQSYQEVQLELVRSLSRSVESYVEDQVGLLGRNDISNIEQEIFKRFIKPVQLLDDGDAWIYAPNYVVFDLSSDFPEEYRGKSMAEIFELQKANGASNYEQMTSDVSNAREGVGWYIWLPEKGPEIAAWTPVRFDQLVWTIGVSTPLTQILDASGATAQIRTSRMIMTWTSLIAALLLAAWGFSSFKRQQAEQNRQEVLNRLQSYKGELEEQVLTRTQQLTDTNDRLKAEIDNHQRTNAQLATINQIGHLITAQLDLNTVLNSITKSAAQLLHTDTGVILLLDETTHLLTVHGSHGLSDHLVHVTQDRLGENIAGRVAQTGEPMRVNDLRQLPGFTNSAAFDEGLIACASVPLWVGERIIGTLDVHSKQVGRSFTHEDERLLMLLADQAAVAIANARLFTAAQQELDERRRVEADLLNARDSAEAASRAKSIFLANMSHELRTPLNAVIGLTGLLLETPLNPTQREYVETVRSSGDALLNVISDILDFSKIEAGKLELEQQAFSLRGCIEDALDLVALLAAQKHLDLLFEIAPTVPDFLVGDVARLRQVLMNLLSNAVKFTERGEVVVRIKQLEATQPKHVKLLIAVQDTGIGIPEDRLDRLFQSFTQVDASTSRVYGGTGLGLVISKRLVELMGGQINIQSVVNSGSTFSMSFEFELATEQVDNYPLQSPALLSGREVLVIDDNATSRRILIEQLEHWGITSHAVASGAEAIAWLMQHPHVDMIITDHLMPQMNGVQVAKVLRELPTTRTTPLLLLTSGYGTFEDPVRLLFTNILTRPIKPAQLVIAVARALGIQVAQLHDQRQEKPFLMVPSSTNQQLRVLLVEDHPINQKVIRRILEQLGYRPDVVADGMEALEALQRQPYDVVLMDIQMPRMDGIEATQAIRDQFAADRQPWIIALTANALAGDREKYLDNGVNDYLAKPVRMEQLRQAFDRVAMAHNPDTVPLVPIEQTPLVLDLEQLNQLKADSGDDSAALIQQLFKMFMHETPLRIEQIEQAIQANNAHQAAELAHSLRGSCAFLGLQALGAVCLQLEQAVQQSQTTGLNQFVPKLHQQYEAAVRVLEQRFVSTTV